METELGGHQFSAASILSLHLHRAHLQQGLQKDMSIKHKMVITVYLRLGAIPGHINICFFLEPCRVLSFFHEDREKANERYAPMRECGGTRQGPLGAPGQNPTERIPPLHGEERRRMLNTGCPAVPLNFDTPLFSGMV